MDPDTAALSTQWFYYGDQQADGTNYGRSKMVIESTGYWQRYEYDAQGRISKEVAQFLNAATNAAESVCRVVEYDYSPMATNGSSERRIEKLLGIEIGRQYTLNYGMETQVIQCQTRGTTNLGAADNLVSVTRYHTGPESAGNIPTTLRLGGAQAGSGGLASVPGHGLDAVADVHLLADVFDVGPHGFQADAQLVADLFVDVAGR